MTRFVELTIPPWGEFLFLTRTAVGAVATHVGMTIEEIEDLHLAVDELCLSLIGPAESTVGQLRVRVEWVDDAIEVRCNLDEPSPGEEHTLGFPDEISERILDALVDEHGLGRENGHRVGWLTKRASLPAAGA